MNGLETGSMPTGATDLLCSEEKCLKDVLTGDLKTISKHFGAKSRLNGSGAQKKMIDLSKNGKDFRKLVKLMFRYPSEQCVPTPEVWEHLSDVDPKLYIELKN